MAEGIGSLRVDLGTNVVQFKDDLVQGQRGIASFAKAVGDQLKNLESLVKKISVGLTAGITAPFAAMMVVSGKGAGGFEAAMNRVQASLKGLDPKQLAEMSKQARQLGPEVGRSAVEAADGIQTLALAGMSAEGILGGGLAATMKLAAANAADLGSAGALVTDVMSQFGKTSGELPPIIDMITGALDSSKLGFVDFQQAIAQAGGVAGSAGVSFEDFNTAIAGTSTLFASGSDAGTSFKTFITSLNPKSEDAARVMTKLGLKFFDTSGKMKDLGVIAGMLQEKLGGLSERSRTDAMTKMFGTDAMRTAIGLMKLGEKGFEDLQSTISKGDAGEKLAIQMQGYEASVNRLKAAFESLKISIGATGLLGLFTSFTTSMGNLVNGIANANPVLLKIGVGLWAMAAALGPLGLAVITLAKLAIPLFIMRLGVMGTILATIINPIGMLAAWFVKLAVVMTGAGSALHLFAMAASRILVPLGLAVTVLTVLYLWLNRTTQANDGLRKSTELAEKALATQKEQSLQLAQATGEARKSLIAKMQADRASAVAALRSAKADLVAAMAARQRAQMVAASTRADAEAQSTYFGGGVMGSGLRADVPITAAADRDARQAIANLRTLTKVVDGYNAEINAPIPTGDPVDLNFAKPETEKRKKKERTGPSAEDIARRREELKLQQMLDVATARGDIEEERRLERLMASKQREQAYEDAGLSSALAKAAAARDMADLQEARLHGLAIEIDLAEKDMDIQAAELRGDQVLIKIRKDELFLHERIQFWRGKELALQEAQSKAAAELAQIEASRTEMQEKLASDRAKERAVELARLRGDSSGVLGRLSREAELARRTREIEERDKINPSQAEAIARAEMDQEDKARLQGNFRDVVKGGFHAALTGDFKGWFKNWWTERLTRSLEDALNNVADMLMRLVSNSFGKGAQSAGSAGGGGLGSIIAGLFGGRRGGPPGISGVTVPWGFGSPLPLPGFKTGGEFTVGGTGGPDSKRISFMATPGEIVNIKRPGSDSGSRTIHFDMRGAVMTQDLLAQMQALANGAEVRATVGGAAAGQAGIYRRAGKTIP